MRGNTLEMCSSLMLPSSLLLMAIFASTPFRPHPDLRQGFVSFDTLKEQGHGWEWMFLTAIGCCKCDINTSGKAERTYFFIPGVKREEYRDNPEIPSRAIDCIQVATTTNLAELVKQCLEFFEAGLFQNEDGIYTFLAATELELTPTLKAFIESKIKVDPTKKYWKQFQIISGPELWNLSPNVFFHHI
ncbi:hypothetical protein Pelo_7106 [Pelomyxa schiedti]|nr:hypothetical protein Pelo_7106 [Pelomyxa schiedti]